MGAGADQVAHEKQVAATAAAQLVEDGMRVGLGTGSTVGYFLEALADRRCDVRCVATSPRTASRARTLGLVVEEFDALDVLDLAVDGADQVAPDGWIVKGAGGALTREKVVAASSTSYVVIVDSSKLVERLMAPVPLELMAYGLASTLRRLGAASLRDAARTPDGGVLADYRGEVADVAALAERLSSVPGVVEHGLFAPTLITKVLVGRGDSATPVSPGGWT
ncbi:MAG TPA: ribose 5-phosphate isomerase A [Acidimicrobiales bacterium]|jgi:ribose 5-phosphate isomerase A|nr:ribose 5-phosphate isomerase A [Acidimicrobiales bacterium]